MSVVWLLLNSNHDSQM